MEQWDTPRKLRTNGTIPEGADTTGYWIAATDQASHQILVMNPAEPDWNSEHAVVWSWRPEESNGFADLLSAWGLPTDAKLRYNTVWGGQWMVITDSLGLAAIIPYPAGDIKKWGLSVGGNPHSAELLPNGNLAVAASTGGWVRVYTSSQSSASATYAEYKLPGAHGLVWDPQRQVLWAVGNDHLIALEINGTDADPIIRETVNVALPTRHGHDLQPVEGDSDRLWVSTGSRVYQFVKSSNTFDSDYPGQEAISRVGVKSVGNQPSGQVVQTVPKTSGSLYEWTTDIVDLFMPDGKRIRTDAAFYKARILIPIIGNGKEPTHEHEFG
ncbi:DUF6528 family protein [Paenibacillus nasutitermitis]|uniref:YncE family protein n=1 Tax=Paenibacillus nasutitermitis TaxID=1652958 RepID=A0A916ZLH5_9BACL|nr:DUF6528 family protein [Paenibacillus nasutitermitis]GGE02697.1 hypothetical protein GCM10010911_72200 [Paenibacillus nasutitermitis]